MPALPPNTEAKVLITGATGYVGQWVLRTLLDRGHTARVAVRSEGKVEVVKGVFPEDVGKLEFVVIENMSKGGAFDEAVVGVDAIIHVATPLPSADDAPEETIRIARQATAGVVKSAFRNGKNVKRVVITSTYATILTPGRTEPYTYGEKNNNEILAEKAVEEFLEKHKQEIGFDVTVINPPFVFGPNLQRTSSPSELLSTSKLWFQALLEKSERSVVPGAFGNAFIDVRDLGEAHVRALEREEAGGERIGVSGGSYIWQEWYDVVRSIAPSVLPKGKADELIKGLPEKSLGKVTYRIRIDTSKEQRILGLKYRTKQELVKGVLEQGLRDGLF